MTDWSTIIRAPASYLRLGFILTFLSLLLTGTIALNPVHAAIPARSTSLSITNVQVSRDSALAHSEPAIAIDPANSNNLVAGSKFFSNPAQYAFQIGTYYSTNGGKTWHDSGILPGYEQYGTTSDISFAFSPNGSIVYAAVLACNGGVCHGTGTASGIYVSRSRDGGKTWDAPTPVYVDPSGAYFNDKPWVGVDTSRGPTRGTVYVAWNLDGNVVRARDPDSGGAAQMLHGQQTSDNSPGGVVVARSTDYGSTFSTPQTLTAFDSQLKHFGLGAIPQVGPDGRVSIAYLGNDQVGKKETDSIQFSTSTNRGKSFSAPRAAVPSISGLPNNLPNSTFRNLSLPTFAVSQKDGAMVIAWADMRNGDADIYSSRSIDGGATWSAPYRVNHDHIGNRKDQFQPELAVAPNGTFTCSWFDRRRDPKNRLIDVYIAQSTDDGRTFGHNYRVTQHSWDPSIDAPRPDPRGKSTFIGDYQALAVSNTAVHPLWNDTQNGHSQEIRTAVVSTQLLAR